ncbi:MAG: hypothetical protein H5U40_10955, partial [Polyangiaceae bacterium]|nr:hypothetical protein [Polyangiaceae bacterium]
LNQVPPAELERIFGEAYAAEVIPGAALRSLSIEGRDDPEAPLVLRYAVETRSLGRRAAARLFVPMLFARSFTRAYAALPSRTTTQLVSGLHEDVVMRFHGTAGQALVPRDVHIGGPSGASYDLASRSAGDVTIVERRVRIRPTLVRVERYRELAAFCRRATEAEGEEVGLPLRP